MLALILVPFLDRGQVVKVTRRTLAIGVVVLAAIGWGGLTAAAVASTPKPQPLAEIDYSAPTDWMISASGWGDGGRGAGGHRVGRIDRGGRGEYSQAPAAG